MIDRINMRVLGGMGLLVLLVAPWALAQDYFRVAPGPLSESHAEFDNSEGCPKCHVANSGVTNAKCLECHKPVRQGIAKASGLHASFTGTCFSCHPGHKGRSTGIIDWKRVGGQQTFEHQRTGFALTGYHAQLACTACHTKRMKSGRTTYLGLDRACDSCHKGVHRFTKAELVKRCELCHVPGKSNHGFRLADWLRKHFERTQVSFSGKHIEQLCIKCHPKAEMPSRATPRRCPDCHRPSHPTPASLGPCSNCHKDGESWKSTSIDHRRFGFALLGKHATLECKRCHQRGGKPTTSPGECTSCHQHREVHKGQFADKPCDTCHVEGGKRTRPFDHDKDARFHFAGFHAEPKVRNKCVSCHPQAIYRTGRLACVDCHNDRHKGQSGPNCTDCHAVDQHWKDAKANVKHTKFTLEGLHRLVRCDKCHPNGKYKLGTMRCVDCHGKTDPHKGELGDDCDKCHIPEKGAPKFNHERMTPFARTGAHASVACGYCHRSARPSKPQVGWTKLEPASKPDRTFPLLGKRCVDCHADPHKGSSGSECQKCHGTVDFRTPLTGALMQRPSDHDRGWLGKHVHLPFDDNDLLAEGRPCAYCHGVPTCDRCHRTMRPKSHTALWRLRAHGTAAAFDSESCRVCHATGMCIQCHRTTAPLNHRGAWSKLHGYAAGTFADNNCYVCHSRGECLSCHPPK